MSKVMLEEATVSLFNDTGSGFEQNGKIIFGHEAGDIKLTPGNECEVGDSIGILKGEFQQGKKYDFKFFEAGTRYRFLISKTDRQVGYVELK